MKTLIKYKLKSLFLIVFLYIPTLIYGVEVCKIPSGCQIDEKGICIDCVEQEFEEDKLERKIEEVKWTPSQGQFFSWVKVYFSLFFIV